MKKTLLITLSLLLGLSNYAQINKKNINHVPMSSLTEIIDINTPSAMGGDEILWSHDFSDTTMIMSEDIAGLEIGDGAQPLPAGNGVKMQV